MNPWTFVGFAALTGVGDPEFERGGVVDHIDDIAALDGDSAGDVAEGGGIEFAVVFAEEGERAAAFVLVDDAREDVRGQFVCRVVVLPDADAVRWWFRGMGADLDGSAGIFRA